MLLSYVSKPPLHLSSRSSGQYPKSTASCIRGKGENLWLLIDPVELSGLVCLDLTLLEPESDLLLGILDAVGAVADIAADVDGVVTADGAWGRGKRVGGTEEDYSN
jgi:hypothetical protein